MLTATWAMSGTRTGEMLVEEEEEEEEVAGAGSTTTSEEEGCLTVGEEEVVWLVDLVATTPTTMAS